MPGTVKKIILCLPHTGSLKHLIISSGIQVIFPFYHTVGNTPDPCISPLYRHRTVKEFIRDLDWLCSRFEPVSLSSCLSEENHTERPQMVLSFDDGLLSCSEVIAPILKEKGIPAVFFLNNDFIGNKGLFFRYLAALLIKETDKPGYRDEKKEIARMLNTSPVNLKRAFLETSYGDKKRLEQAAEMLGFSVHEYLQNHPVYMDEEQIKKLMSDGFEIGCHTGDHPLLGKMNNEEIIAEIKDSMNELEALFNPGYRYFAFPFTDYGVPEYVMTWLFEEGIIDAAFGTAGIREQTHENLFQRIPMEVPPYSAKRIVKAEYSYFRMKKIFLD